MRCLHERERPTDTRALEARLKESEERLRVLVEQSLAGIYMTREGRLVYLNARFAEFLGRSVDELLGCTTDALVHPEDLAALRAARQALQTGQSARESMTLRYENPRLGWVDIAITVAATVFRGERVLLVSAQDISDTVRAKRQVAEHAARIEASMLATVRALAATLELRDPYTAGHQRRVGALARAIGEELGLSQERLLGLELAGQVHDIGKIAVPSEILSKPGRLSRVEYELLKQHPERGWEILKDVDFPWPLATAIRQHHERLDGSGYPHGLSGDAIILEARIIAVADIVEAMSSHRPYRPGRGLEAALQQVRHDIGALDATVVAACERVFERGWQVEGEPVAAHPSVFGPL